ncbi:hypothetical protein [Pseudomonas sp. MF4836]|uniref:hypothetical protein n=1 Tax=Pseudomonas sp. MF4836 TaxID=1960827 RepID=UPI0009965B3F|nr:hypothetical protein [Pseudomonas sp. MF4836]OOV98448.1 hypothetical protein MF4836_08860 [Pseudomonas sp. MF4836]
MNATATNAPAATTEVDFKKKYEETNEPSNAGLHNPVAKNLSEKVLTSFYDVLTPKAELNLQAQIKQAAAVGDFDALEALMAQRKEIKANQAKDGNIIKEIRKHDFPLVLKAFRAEFDAIIYEIAYNVLTGSHKAIVEASKSTRAPRGSKATGDDAGGEKATRKKSLFKVTKPDGTVVDFPVIMGPKGNTDFKAVEDAYKALGFEVKKDGDEYVVEPGTIELKAGGNVMVNRVNLMEAIEKQTSAQFDGWTVEKIKID